MPIAVVVAAVLSFFVAVGVRNFPYTPKRLAPTPTVSNPSVIVTPSEAPSVSSETLPSNAPKPSSSKIVTKTPTPTPKAVQYSMSTPSPVIRTFTGTPTPSSDTSAPTFDYMTGPAEGSTVTFNSFCFPMKFSDASSPITVRYGMDAGSPSDWNQNYAPCYSSVPNGSHTFMVQAKDGVGNISELVKRNFIVDVANPTNQITQSPTPTPTSQVTQ